MEHPSYRLACGLSSLAYSPQARLILCTFEDVLPTSSASGDTKPPDSQGEQKFFVALNFANHSCRVTNFRFVPSRQILQLMPILCPPLFFPLVSSSFSVLALVDVQISNDSNVIPVRISKGPLLFVSKKHLCCSQSVGCSTLPARGLSPAIRKGVAACFAIHGIARTNCSFNFLSCVLQNVLHGLCLQ